MASVDFEFPNHPGVTYHAVRDDTGFIQIYISAGGDRVEVCGFLVTQTPPPPAEE